LRASIDLTALRRGAAIDAAVPEPVWSDDCRTAALCVVEPAQTGGITQPACTDTARRWLDAWRRRPGDWPDLDGVVAAGVIVDLDRDEIVAAVDRMGVHSLYWSLDGQRLRVASHAADALPHGDRGPRLDPRAIYAYVYFHHVPSPLCIYGGVGKLPRAHCLRIHRGDASVRRYRLETFPGRRPARPEPAAAALVAALRAAVAGAMQGTTADGAFLSGGLDSSTVAGLMAERMGRGVAQSFSIGFDAAGYDEMEFARIAARHFGLRSHEHYLTPDELLALTPSLLRATEEPFGNSSIAAAYRCALLAREAGVERLLAGDGGDELFAGNSRYAKQLVFERYQRVPRPLRRGVLEPLFALLGRLAPASPLGKAARFAEQARVPLPDRLQSYNYLHRHDPEEMFERSFLDAVDTALPLRLWREEYAAPAAADTVNRMLFLDWAFTLHDNDLVKVNGACRAAGVGVAYPMLDHALVDLACSLAGSTKMPGGELRGFYKQAMRDLLPPATIRKTKHGFGMPFGVWTRTHPGLARMSQAALDSLAGRGIFRSTFLRETLRLHREGHAAYYGELVWVLAALEFWLEAHEATLAA
jgi:asparagine synthase (glutamine-hydrolysing)